MSGFLLQSTFGGGNFELVTDNPHDGLRGLTHRFRNNADAGLPWVFGGQFFRTRYTVRGPSAIQDADPLSRRLHVVARIGDAAGHAWIGHFVRDNGPTWSWHEPVELPGSRDLALSGDAVSFESTVRPRESFEVLAPLASGGIGHWRFTDRGWEHIGISLSILGRIDAVAAFDGRLGRVEVLIRRGTRLEHVRRSRSAVDDSWSAPVTIGNHAVGSPGFVQGRHGRNGNFEVVFADVDGGLSFAWCDNDDASAPRWNPPVRVIDRIGEPGESPGDTDAVALIQSNYGTPGLGNLELIVRRGGACHFAWRADRSPWAWSGPWRLAAAVPDGPAFLRRAGRLSERLAGCDDLQNAITWETATGTRRVYAEWTRAQQDRLDALFALLQSDAADLGLRCSDPAANMALRRRPDGGRAMFLTADEAFDVYAAHVAHAFHLESSGAVAWSLFDLPSAERHELLASDRFHVRILPTSLATAADPYYPPHIQPGRDYQLPYRVLITGFPMGSSCDPRVGYRFIRGRNRRSGIDLLASTEEETLANLCRWVSQSLGHGGAPTHLVDAYFVTHNRLIDRLRSETLTEGTSSWTGLFAPAGCHSASNLLHDLARSVNIPLLNVVITDLGAHQGLMFRWNRTDPRLCPHTDNLYRALAVAPFYSVDETGSADTIVGAARRFFELSFAPLAELSRFGFRHATDYGPHLSRVDPEHGFDSPDYGCSGGSWAMVEDARAFLLDRRIRLGSWRQFLKVRCDAFRVGEAFTAAELMRINSGAWLALPWADIERQAQACLHEHDDCGEMQARSESWVTHEGDTWVD